MQNKVSKTLVQANSISHFLYVRDLKQSITMYSNLFGFPIKEEEILFGHLYFMPNGVILDSNDMGGRPIPDWLPVSLKLATTDIDKTKVYVEELGFDITYGVDRGPTVSWFLFKDPDGNTLMMCHDHN